MKAQRMPQIRNIILTKISTFSKSNISNRSTSQNDQHLKDHKFLKNQIPENLRFRKYGLFDVSTDQESKKYENIDF